MKKFLHSHFVPHIGNGYTPSLLQRLAMGGMVLLVLLSFAVTNIQALFWQSSDWLVGAVLPAVVTSLTNEERVSVQAPALMRSTLLDAAAQLKADHMAAEGYFAHYSPGGISPWFWFDQVGYTYVHAGENLAVHFSDSDEVVEAWMNSPTHRANIINSNYTEIGIGISRGSYEGYATTFVVQMFGTPGIAPVLSTAPEASFFLADRVTVEATSSNVSELAKTSTTSVVLGIETHPKDNSSTTIEASELNDLSTAVTRETLSEETIEDVKPADLINEAAPATSVARPILLQSDTVSSSTNLSPASATLMTPNRETSAPKIAELATQPSTVLQLLYISIGSLTAILLAISVVVGWKKRTLVQVWYGVGLLVLISLLFYIHVLVTSGAQII